MIPANPESLEDIVRVGVLTPLAVALILLIAETLAILNVPSPLGIPPGLESVELNSPLVILDGEI